MIYVMEQKPCRMLSKFAFEKESKAFVTEINLRKVEWLLVCPYDPIFCYLVVHLNDIHKAIEFNPKTHDKILINRWRF